MKKGFTLIEILVVVLIIGILAAIAVPQYQKAVAKTKFSTLKNNAKTILEAEQIYYLANGNYTNKLADLDMDISNIKNCLIGNINNTSFYAQCGTIINKIYMYYIVWIPSGKQTCLTQAYEDRTHISHWLCQQESGIENPSYCGEGNCQYHYK